MANIQQLLNDEIRRLARKEVIALEKEYKSQLVELRRTAAELKNRIKNLEKAVAGMNSAAAEKKAQPEVEAEETKAFRITPQRITKWRQMLGLKRAQYAKLLGVSPLSVAHWENGKSEPRAAQKSRIAQLRDMGKKELNKLCVEKGVKLNKNAANVNAG